MAITVETKDCTALTDTELAEMADLCANGGDGVVSYEAGLLSKQSEEWVLVTRTRVDEKLHAFSFCTLERIGGTPCVLIGLAHVRRSSKRDGVLRALMHDQYHRALMAFPDEDVLLATRIASPSGFEVFKHCKDIVPRPGYRAIGEDRAWGRRLSKRFGVDGDYDDRGFVAKGDGSSPCLFDHVSAKELPEGDELVTLFEGVEEGRGDCVVTFGWLLAEDLVKLGG